MAKKKTVIKVAISGKKCQTDIMKAVAKIDGIEKMEIDPSKGTLTIIGEVEPVPIFKKLKKIGKQPEIVTVGPPRPKCPPYCFCNLCRPKCPADCTCNLCCPYVQYTQPIPYYAYNNRHCDLVAVHEYPSASYADQGQCTIM